MAEYSGKFILRMPAETHRNLRHEADKRGISLNRLCVELLIRGLNPPRKDRPANRYASLGALLRRKFGDGLWALLIFGSQVTGRATEASDVDFLVVLDRKIPLERSLYRWWDQRIDPPAGEVWNPQFVHLPDSPDQAGSLWLETALAHERIWEKGRKVSALLARLRAWIEEGRVRRHIHQGQPYWVWDGEKRGDAA